MKEIEQEIEKVKMKDAAVHAQEFENAANLRDKQTKLENNMKMPKMSGKQLKVINPLLSKEDIGEVIAGWTGIPLTKLMKLNRIDY